MIQSFWCIFAAMHLAGGQPQGCPLSFSRRKPSFYDASPASRSTPTRRLQSRADMNEKRADTAYTCATPPTSPQRVTPFHWPLDMKHGPGLKS